MQYLRTALKHRLPTPAFRILRKATSLWRDTYFFTSPRYVIDHRRKLIYLTLPKNACSSIKTTFFQQTFADNGTIHLTDEAHVQHTTTRLHKLRHTADYFKFSFVRNPFSRVYSCYLDKLVKRRVYEYYLGGYLGNVETFDEFVLKISRIPMFLSEKHFMSQYFHIHQHHRAQLDFIGRYEHLAQDFEAVKQRFQLKPLPRFNQSQNHPDEWMAHYTKQTAALVYEKYQQDFDAWYPSAYDELLASLK